MAGAGRPRRAASAALRRPVGRSRHALCGATRAPAPAATSPTHYDLGQRLLRADARPDDDLLVRACSSARTRRSRRRASPRSTGSAASSSSRPEDHLLEIGTGWGALRASTPPPATAAASRPPRSRASSTSSRRERVADAGLADRVTVLLADYRDLAGRYDKLVSVEMIEAVGAEYYDTFFATCALAARAPDGLHGAAGHHRGRPALRAARARASTSSSATSSRAAASRRSRRCCRPPRRAERPAPRRPRGLHAALRDARWPPGATNLARNAEAVARAHRRALPPPVELLPLLLRGRLRRGATWATRRCSSPAAREGLT